jgi:hypothetical protein
LLPSLLLHFAKGWGDQPHLKLYNKGSLLLPKGDVCAPEHKAHQSTKEALNFRELRYGEVHLALSPHPGRA